MLIFEAYAYNFLLLFDKVDLLSFNFKRASRFAFSVLKTVGEFLVKYNTIH